MANGEGNRKDVVIDIVNPADEYKVWLGYAKDDFDVAEYVNNGPFYPKPYNIICYHYQQAAEKSAKALVVYYRKPGGMAKVHDIDFQLKQIKNLVKTDKGLVISDEMLNMASDISIYASEMRYPNETPADENDVIKARRICITIMEWVKSAIDAPSLNNHE